MDADFYQFWRNLDLAAFQRELDGTAAAVAARQDGADEAKKLLVEAVGRFKAEAGDEARKQAASLLQSLQQGIDASARRCAASDAALLDVCRRLVEMPDPLPLVTKLDQRAAKAGELEVEVATLRKTLEQYHEELRDVTNQDVTIRQLRERVKAYEESMKNSIDAVVAEREKTIRGDFEGREAELRETIDLLSRKLVDAERQTSLLEQSLQFARRDANELRASHDDKGSASATQLDMALEELERTQQRALAAEREVESLREQQTRSSPKAAEMSVDDKYEMEIAMKDRQIAQLLEELRVNHAQLTMAGRHEAIVEGTEGDPNLSFELSSLQSEVARLETALQKQADYAEMKKELEILRTHEASGLPEDTEKRLESFQSQCEDLKLDVENGRLLAAKLEADLLRLGGRDRLASGSHVVAGQFDPEDPKIPLEDLSADGSSDTILSIVTAQRDRLRSQIEQLEKVQSQQAQELSMLRADSERSRADNVRLYEKIRFLQSYDRQRVDQRPQGEDVVAKYSAPYEESLDPFRKFHAAEAERRYTALKPHDKVTLSIGRLITSSPHTRLGFFVYLLLLHCLVFLVLYLQAHTEMCEHDKLADCKRSYDEHMREAHGDVAHMAG